MITSKVRANALLKEVKVEINGDKQYYNYLLIEKFSTYKPIFLLNAKSPNLSLDSFEL